MKLCDVNTFNMGTPKDKSLKPLEEAAEIVGAYQLFEENNESLLTPFSLCGVWSDVLKKECLLEISDCITACCNLAAFLECDDLTPYLEEVENKNRERGRYDV